VFLEKGNRAAQHGFVQIVAQISNHAKAGVVGKIRSGVVADSLQQRGDNEGEGDDRPLIVEMGRNEGLQIEMEARSQRGKHRHVLVTIAWMEDVVEDRANEQDAKGIEEADTRCQHHGRDDLKPVPAGVLQQPPPTLHCRFLACVGGN
jgi:hypothetical protein